MKKEDIPCRCPYCDTPIFDGECRPCGVKITYCSHCGAPIPKGADSCPECGERASEASHGSDDAKSAGGPDAAEAEERQ